MQIQTSEIDPAGFKPKKFKKFYVVLLILLAFFVGVQFGQGRAPLPASVRAIFEDRNREAAPRSVDWQLLWDAIERINEKYVNRPADMQNVLYGAVSGAVAALGDPYSVFFPPQEAQEFKNELKGDFEGIGAEIAIKNQALTVVSPIEDSPAQKAGIKAGDFIYKVDGAETAEMTIEVAVSKIRGPAGTVVTLTIFHKGDTKPVDIKVTRGKIEIKSLSYEIKEVNGKQIGYLKLRRFGEETSGEIDKAITEFLLRGVDGVIFDVRNNPGGFLDSAVEIASKWVKEGDVVVIQRYGSGTEEVHKAKGQNRLGTISTVVLINGGSASASEIVAGALRDHGLAKLIGEKSFGKGSVQELIDLRAETQLKLTIAKWLTPSGHDLNQDGLEPDEKVELSTEDFQNDHDPQLERAMEILSPAAQ